MRKAIPTIFALAALATIGACTRPSTVSLGRRRGVTVNAGERKLASDRFGGHRDARSADRDEEQQGWRHVQRDGGGCDRGVEWADGRPRRVESVRQSDGPAGLEQRRPEGRDLARLRAHEREWSGAPVRGEHLTATNLQTEGGDSRNETLKKAGIGAAAGAVLGAVIGGGDVSKILGGAAIGAAAGTVISLGAGEVDAVLPAGSRMTLQTTQQIVM